MRSLFALILALFATTASAEQVDLYVDIAAHCDGTVESVSFRVYQPDGPYISIVLVEDEDLTPVDVVRERLIKSLSDQPEFNNVSSKVSFPDECKHYSI